MKSYVQPRCIGIHGLLLSQLCYLPLLVYTLWASGIANPPSLDFVRNLFYCLVCVVFFSKISYFDIVQVACADPFIFECC